MRLQSKNESETINLGKRLGQKLKPGDVVCLYGELGAGKTTITKGIASSFGIKERDITSASYTIIAEYDGDIPFYHIDLYRIMNGEAPELGLHEYFHSNGISVIEWAEKADDEIPDNCIKIRMNHAGDDVREIELEGLEL
jgi:tRNA threonylcarbamoyladenosine biosynthesis protein TsaE